MWRQIASSTLRCVDSSSSLFASRQWVMHLPQSRKVCAAATTGGRLFFFFLLSCVAHSRSDDDDDDDRFGGDRMRMNERMRKRKGNNSPVGWVNEWSVWFFSFPRTLELILGHLAALSVLYCSETCCFFLSLSSLFLSVFLVLFVFYQTPDLLFSLMCWNMRDPLTGYFQFHGEWMGCCLTGSHSNVAAWFFGFFFFSPSSVPRPEPIILYSGRESSEGAILVARRKRERERKKPYLLWSFVCWPWVAMFSETEGVVVFFLSCLCVSIFEKCKKKNLISLVFSRKKRRLMIGTMPTECRTIWPTLFCLYHVLACSKNGRWVI